MRPELWCPPYVVRKPTPGSFCDKRTGKSITQDAVASRCEKRVSGINELYPKTQQTKSKTPAPGHFAKQTSPGTVAFTRERSTEVKKCRSPWWTAPVKVGAETPVLSTQNGVVVMQSYTCRLVTMGTFKIQTKEHLK